MARPSPSGNRTTPPGKRARIGTLDIIIVIVGVLGIIGYNRLSIANLQRSLPNANTQIVGEWKSTRGPEHLVFRPDKTIGVISAPGPAQGDSAQAARKPKVRRRLRQPLEPRHRRLSRLPRRWKALISCRRRAKCISSSRTERNTQRSSSRKTRTGSILLIPTPMG